MEIYRIQDKHGRGPFRPNFTQKWCEYHHELPSILHEFPDLLREMDKFHKKGFHIGVGVRGESGIAKWFCESEIEKLKALGFKIVQCVGVSVVCESDNQVVFASNLPLKELPALPPSANVKGE